MEQQIPKHARNIAAGGCNPSKIRTRLTFFKNTTPLCSPSTIFAFHLHLLPFPMVPQWVKWRDNLWRNSKRHESRDYPKRKMVDDGIFKALPEMIARALGLRVWICDSMYNFSPQKESKNFLLNKILAKTRWLDSSTWSVHRVLTARER